MIHDYIGFFQFQPTNNAVAGSRLQAEIGYRNLIQEREENRIRNFQNQQEKAPENLDENVESNETANGSIRITFDLRQLKILEGYFQQGLTHPNAETKELLAEELGISSLGHAVVAEAQHVHNWFHSRRQKVKNPEKDKKAREVLEEVEVTYVSNPDLNNSIRYQEQLRSRGNHHPYPQPVHPQVPQVQPAVGGFNPGLAAAINNFGLNILRKPNPFELPGPQGNPNPLMQQIRRPEMRQRPDIVQPAIRGIPGVIPCCTPSHHSSKNPKGLHSRHCTSRKYKLPIEVPHSIVSNNNLENVQNVQNIPDGRNDENPTNGSKPKRNRTTFRGEHLESLENVYKDNKYPGNERMQQLALELNLTFGNVLHWFKNRRSKDPTTKKKK